MRAAGRDAITGWFIYHCGGGVLLVPTERCVGPECRGGSGPDVKTLGYAGDLDAGSKGSFMQAGRLIGVTAFDGVELGKGLAAIDELRQENQIDAYYAGAAKRAFLQRIDEEGEREAPFEEPSPFGRVLAPGALGRRYRGVTGDDVGPTVTEACRCTPRPFDARDPVSGWGIYYVKGGVYLTPTEKCIAETGGTLATIGKFWRAVLTPVLPAQPVAPQPTLALPALPPGYVTTEPGAPAPAPAPTVPVTIPGTMITVCKPGYVAQIFEYQLAAYTAAGWTRC
jgi:hypothetical protein